MNMSEVFEKANAAGKKEAMREGLYEFPCGFAWVSVRPRNKGNTRLGKAERAELKEANFRLNEYEKTFQLWVSDFNQSVQKKEAYASAFVKVLREYGFNAYSGSRLD